MAATERISKLYVQPHDRESVIDIREAKLPVDKPTDTETEAYDPRKFRLPRQTISPWMAYFNLSRSMLGPGLLAMPLNISMAGTFAGSFITIFTGVLIIHTHLLLLSCLYEVSRQLKIPYVSYRYGFRLALLHGPPCLHYLGQHGPSIISTFMLMTQLGICTATVIMTADSLRDILDWHSTNATLTVLLVPYLCLEFLMKNLQWISYVSLASTGINFLGLILVFYFIFTDPHGETIMITSHFMNLLFAFGSSLFNLSAVGVILALDKSLEDSKIMVTRYGVIRIGIAIPTILATVLGISGYWAFGNMEENILRSLPFDDDIAMVCVGLYMVAVVLAFPLQCYPAISVIIEVIKYSKRSATPPTNETLEMIEVLARPVLVITTFIFCYIAPFQAPIVAFVGNLCTSLLSLVFPALMDISLRYPHAYGPYRLILLKDVAIVILGIVSWLVGAIYCFYLIYVRLLARRSINNRDYF